MSQKTDLKELAEKWPNRLEYTGLEKILVAISIMIVAVTAGHLAFVYGDLPAQIPTHFDFEGNVDDYDSKVSLIVLVLINAATCLMIIVGGHFPKLFNIPMGLLKRPLEDVLHSTRVFLYFTVILMALLFLYIQEGSILVANGVWLTLSPFGIWAFVGVLFVAMGFYFYWLWRG